MHAGCGGRLGDRQVEEGRHADGDDVQVGLADHVLEGAVDLWYPELVRPLAGQVEVEVGDRHRLHALDALLDGQVVDRGGETRPHASDPVVTVAFGHRLLLVTR